jgi:hypothetical protein
VGATLSLNAGEQMTDATSAGGPPPGWLHDRGTGQTRWWDGTRWTEHVQPTAPAAPAQYQPQYSSAPYPSAQYSSGQYSAATLTSKNGPAKASLILILILVLGVSALIWFLSGADPTIAVVLGFVNILMVIAALVLAIIGLVIAIRRPTKKRESIFALVFSSLLLVFLIFRVAVSANTIDSAVLESQIGTWIQQQTGETAVIDCPDSPPDVVGSSFDCTSVGASGTTWTIRVTVDEATVSWQIVE